MKRSFPFCLVLSLILSYGPASAASERRALTAPKAVKGDDSRERLAAPQVSSKGATAQPRFTHQTWGRTTSGDGLIFGDTLSVLGVAVADMDVDQDYDFVTRPSFDEPPQIIRNLGTSGAFVPGGQKDLDIPEPADGSFLTSVMDFADVNGDGLPDMVGLTWNSSTTKAGLALYANLGPLSEPRFIFADILHTSEESGFPLNIPKIVDYDGDGLLDIVFVQPFLDSGRQTGVFLIRNEGVRRFPSWAAAVEITELSRLMPPLRVAKNQAEVKAVATMVPRSFRPTYLKARKSQLLESVSDIEMADWDVDGDLDFMFYDKSEGIHWIENLGSNSTPVWDPFLTSAGLTLDDDYLEEDVVIGHGSFALRTNPNLVGADWLDDWYIQVGGKLNTWRYFVNEKGYRLIDQAVTTFPLGQGAPSFWDFDGDGDLDMFILSTFPAEAPGIRLFVNRGTPYAPVWDDWIGLDSITLSSGSFSNDFRQDVLVFSDADADGVMELFVQGQDGRIARFRAAEPESGQTLPTFTLLESDFGGIIASETMAGQTNLSPRGIAFANFNDLSDGMDRVFAAFASDQGGKIVFYSPGTGSVSDVSSLFDDEFGNDISPNSIESLAVGDLNQDGRQDLLVTICDGSGFSDCAQYFYRNGLNLDDSFFIEFVSRLDVPYETDKFYGRMATLVDIDADGDPDLFVAHQRIFDGEPPESNRSRYHRFYRNDTEPLIDFWRTRVVSGQTWDLIWNGYLPDYRYVLNASGGSLPYVGTYRAGETSRVVDIIESTDLDRNVRTFVEVLPPVTAQESKAILVIGDDPADSLFDTFLGLAGFAYRALRLQGLPADSIRFFAEASVDTDGDGLEDVFGVPSLASLETAITDWAQDTERLLIYLIDHGQRDRFRINGAEYLEAADLAAWVNQLQPGGVGPQVTTIIDTCESGTFIDDLALSEAQAKGGAKRITITSANVGPISGIALFDQRTFISFSLAFWREIFDGRSYGEAFDRAKIVMEAINPLQRPQIDDDGDGVPNEANDGLLANSVRPGADFEVAGSTVFIGEVARNQTATTNRATLWLGDVVSNFPIEEAGALIVPPNFQRRSAEGDDEQPVTGLTWVNFSFSETNDRWEAVFDGLNEGGLYRAQFFVRALGQYFASPRIGFIDRVGIPDAWEADNSFARAQWLPINSVQGHNFHAANDEDWVLFTTQAGEAATLAILSPGQNNRPTVDIWRAADLEADANASPVTTFTAPKRGRELIQKRVFETSELFTMRIRNSDPSIFGEGTSYLVLVAIGTGGIIPTTLIVNCVDSATSMPLVGVQVGFNGSVTNNSTSTGVAQFTVPEFGTYGITATKAGYQTVNTSVVVNNSIDRLTISMQTGPGGEGEGEGEGGGEGEGEGEGCAAIGPFTTPLGPGVFGGRLGDALLFSLLALGLFLARPKRCA